MELGQPPTIGSTRSCCDEAEYEARGEVGYIQLECRVLGALCPTLDLRETKIGRAESHQEKSTTTG